MGLPFTTEAFFDVFTAYNRAIFPAQAVAYGLGAAAVVEVWRPGTRRWMGGLLALFWAWTGVAYHMLFFAPVNPPAWGFGAAFVVEGLLLGQAAWSGALAFRFVPGPRAWAGAALVGYALVIYPVLGHLLGHGYPRAPVFGVSPCPTTIFTVGLLLWAERCPRRLVVIPLLWSGVGASAAVLLGVREDLGLLAAAAGGAWLLAKPGPTGAARAG